MIDLLRCSQFTLVMIYDLIIWDDLSLRHVCEDKNLYESGMFMDVELYEFNNTILTITMLFSLIMIVVLGAYVHVNSQRTWLYRWFIARISLLFLWNWTYMLRRYAPDLTTIYVLLMFEVLAVCFIGPVTLCLARSYRGWSNKASWLVRSAFAGAFLLAVFVITNPLHHQLIVEITMTSIEFSDVYMLIALFVICCFIGSVYFFVVGVKRPSAYWKKQIANVGGSALVLALASLVEVLGLVSLDVSLVILAMPFSLIFLGIAVMKYQFMDILPYTLLESVNFIDDGFMVFSNDGSLEDFNERFFDRMTSFDKCKSIDEVMNAFGRVMSNKVTLNNLKESLNVRKDTYISGELLLNVNETKMHLQYITKAINDSSGMKIATIITFHDMSDLQSLYEVLEEQKIQLLDARERLEHHIETIQELTIETERNRLMAEVHDTLGHSMTEVLTLLEKCDMILGDPNPDTHGGSKVIEEALKQSRESLVEIRAAVGRFRKMGIEL